MDCGHVCFDTHGETAKENIDQIVNRSQQAAHCAVQGAQAPKDLAHRKNKRLEHYGQVQEQ